MKPFFSTMFRCVAMVLACIFVPLAEAQIVSVGDAINKAGRQRMLSQRMAKAYLQIGQGIDAERSRKILSDSVALFDRQAVELKVYAPTPEIKDVYVRVEQKWNHYKEFLVGMPANPESGTSVVALGNEILDLANMGTLLLEQHSGKASSKLVNTAGRQRMLSQRMAMLYQAQAWNLKVPGATADIDKAKAEFVQAMKVLQAAPDTTAEIKGELAMAGSQWIFFQNALAAKSQTDKAEMSLNVATSSERILEVMDKVTSMYSKLSQ
jgi:nitrate/nitrite-specific signal transduction histidine kinase